MRRFHIGLWKITEIILLLMKLIAQARNVVITEKYQTALMQKIIFDLNSINEIQK